MQYIVFRNYGLYNPRNIFRVAGSLDEAIRMVPVEDLKRGEKDTARHYLERGTDIKEPLYLGEAGIYPVQS